MTPEQTAAYIFAQAVCAMAEIEGMKAKNKYREIVENNSPDYTEDDFARVIEKYGIHHNGVMCTYQGC